MLYGVWGVSNNHLAALNHLDQQVPPVYLLLIKDLIYETIFDKNWLKNLNTSGIFVSP
jgi:hypothetical protein